MENDRLRQLVASLEQDNNAPSPTPAGSHVRATIGRYPNTLLLGPSVFNAAKKHPKVVDKLKYTTSASIIVGC